MLKDTIYKCLSWKIFIKLPLGAEPYSTVASYGLEYSCLTAHKPDLLRLVSC